MIRKIKLQLICIIEHMLFFTVEFPTTKCIWNNFLKQTMSTFPTLNLQLYVLQDLLSCKVEQNSPFSCKVQWNQYIFLPQSVQKYIVVTTTEFSIFPIKLSSNFLHCSNIHKSWENIIKFAVLSSILARLATMLPVA